MKKIFAGAFIILLILIGFQSIFADTVILLNGKLTDKSSGKPVSAKIKFIDKTGKVHNSLSNSIDGAFQQVLPPGNEYFIVVEGWLTDESNRILKVPNYKEYTEIGYSYELEEIKPGLIISTDNFFEKNDFKIKTGNDEIFKFIKVFTANQKNVILNAVINSSDSYFTSKTVKVASTLKRKKTTKSIQVTNEMQLNELLEKRKTALTEKLEELGIPVRILNISTELVVNKPKPVPKTKSKVKVTPPPDMSPNNLTFAIEKIMKF